MDKKEGMPEALDMGGQPFQRLGFGGWEMIMCLEYRTPKGVQFIVAILCPAVETAGYPNPRPNGLD